MKIILTFILLAFFISSHGQDKVPVPKKFKTDTFALLDLCGDVKTVSWVSWNYMASGNASNIYKGYYKGTIDFCDLKFDEKGAIVTSKYLNKSIQTYTFKNDTYNIKDESVLLDSSSTINIKQFSYYLNYKKLIVDDNALKLIDEIYQFKYNDEGDLVEKICFEEKKYKSLSCHIVYEYVYDKNNNWIEKSVFDMEDGKVLTLKTKRQIEYM